MWAISGSDLGQIFPNIWTTPLSHPVDISGTVVGRKSGLSIVIWDCGQWKSRPLRKPRRLTFSHRNQVHLPSDGVHLPRNGIHPVCRTQFLYRWTPILWVELDSSAKRRASVVSVDHVCWPQDQRQSVIFSLHTKNYLSESKHLKG